jgi:hypothetical protein
MRQGDLLYLGWRNNQLVLYQEAIQCATIRYLAPWKQVEKCAH